MGTCLFLVSRTSDFCSTFEWIERLVDFRSSMVIIIVDICCRRRRPPHIVVECGQSSLW